MRLGFLVLFGLSAGCSAPSHLEVVQEALETHTRDIGWRLAVVDSLALRQTPTSEAACNRLARELPGATEHVVYPGWNGEDLCTVRVADGEDTETVLALGGAQGGSPLCGNGRLDAGEECDGKLGEDWAECDPATCTVMGCETIAQAALADVADLQAGGFWPAALHTMVHREAPALTDLSMGCEPVVDAANDACDAIAELSFVQACSLVSWEEPDACHIRHLVEFRRGPDVVPFEFDGRMAYSVLR